MSPSPRTIYLTAYNAVFSSLWFYTLAVALLHAQDSKEQLFKATSPQARWIQTASLVEILHSAFRLVKSPVGTTATQVLTRTIQVWMIWYCFPTSTASSSAYLALVLAWSMADGVRYAYLALNMHGKAPGWLVWLRYTMFYILYPIGIGAEWWLMYRAVGLGGEINSLIPPIFYFLLALYVPGAYKMYTYMIKQRKKTLVSKQEQGKGL